MNLSPPTSLRTTTSSTLGRLVLMPNTLDLGYEPQALEWVLPHAVIQQAAQISHWVVENAKSTRAFLKRIQNIQALCKPLQELQIHEIPKPTKGQAQGKNHPNPSLPAEELKALLHPLMQGHDVGLLSEAGLPAIADPGSSLVALAHQWGAKVLPLSGPSSLMLALAASGLHGQAFAFVGYLPQDSEARAARIRFLEQRSHIQHETQLVIETPYRNQALFSAMLQHLTPSTQLSVACGLTLPSGWVQTQSIQQWKKTAVQFEKGLPCVFSFLA